MNQIINPLKALNAYFNHSGFRHGQQEIIEHILNKKNTLVVMPTGSGKSICYQVPALISEGITIVVSPLIALMKDQVDQLRQLKIAVTFINSSISVEEQNQRIAGLRDGQYKIVYIAPERFSSLRFMEALKDVPVSLFAIDEAHCISQWGHDFRPSYLQLKNVIKKIGKPTVAALTATATKRVQQDIIKQLDLKEMQLFVSGFDRPNLKFFAVELSEEKKRKELIRIIKSIPGSGVVYVATQKAVQEITDLLKENGLPAAGYHGGMEKGARTSVQNNWLIDKPAIIVATNAFGMGIDKADVRFVIHFNSPASMEAYYQEAGRAGRDNRTAYCILFHSYRDRRIQEYLIKNSFPGQETIRSIYDYLFSLNRQQILLTYKEIADRTANHEMQVAAAVKLLERYHILKRMSGSFVTFQAQLINTGQKALQLTKRSQLQQNLLQYISDHADSVFELQQTLQDLDMTQEQFSKTMHALEAKNLLFYTPPFRGRGIELTSTRQEWSKIPIDWKAYTEQMELQYQKLDDIETYAKQTTCRRKHILSYFGETFKSDNCKACDVCLDWQSPEAESSTHLDDKPLNIILNCVREFDGQYGITTISAILAGMDEKRFRDRLIDKSVFFGALKHRQQKDIIRTIYAGISKAYLKKTGDDYPVLIITDKGISYLRRN